MKQKYIILFFLLLPLDISYSQWVMQYSQPGSSLYDCTFINSQTGWACGDLGILKTTNGGTNWFIQSTGISQLLEGIYAVDSQYVYCVGDFNTILKTTNGGANWNVIRFNLTFAPSFLNLYFLNRNTGWLLKTNTYVLRTHDGGNSFDSSYVNIGFPHDIFFKDSLNGIFCCDGAAIFKSTDGGVIWNQIQIPIYNFAIPNFYRESFVADYGWVGGGGIDYDLGALCWRTTDFGSSWDTISRIPYPNGSVGNGGIYFSNLNTGWCGGIGSGYVFKTINGGFNWYQQTVPDNAFRNTIWFYNDSIGWAVGGGAHILHTSNGGTYVSLKKINSNIPVSFELYQNFPNPFNPTTLINYELPTPNHVLLTIYDILRREITNLVNENQNQGKYAVNWDASGYSSGTYFCKLTAYDISELENNFTETKKLILLK